MTSRRAVIRNELRSMSVLARPRGRCHCAAAGDMAQTIVQNRREPLIVAIIGPGIEKVDGDSLRASRGFPDGRHPFWWP